MSGEPNRAKSLFIPPPIKGINLIASPAQVDIAEARELENYWVYDSGIRQMPDVTLNKNYTGAGDNAVVILTTQASKLFFAVQAKIWRLDSATSTTPTDVTGAAVITSHAWNVCVFNKRFFLFNGTDAPLQHDFGAGNVTAFSATGPTLTTLKQATGFKSRLYIVQNNSTTYWYGGVDAFTGTFTSVDLGSIISRIDSTILCMFNWTFNQGLNNEELLVILTNRGEVLVYSGDYPSAPNWTIIARSYIPVPATALGGVTGQPFYRIGNEIYIITLERGVIPMSTIISGAVVPDGYYNVSRNIKNQIQSFTNFGVCLDPSRPFLYVSSSTMPNKMFVMNYEIGAWSLYGPTIGALAPNIISAAIFGDYLMIGTSNPTSTEGNLYNVLLTSAAATTLTYKWKTPFINFGSVLQKNSKAVRVLGLNYGVASTFTNTASLATDFVDPTTPTTDTKATAVAADIHTVQELTVPGTGRWLSYAFSRAGSGISNEKNEIQGMEVIYEEGGYY